MERRASPWHGPVVRATRGAYGRRVLVLAGKGNNGGDGLCGSHLAAWGAFPVAVFPATRAHRRARQNQPCSASAASAKLRFEERSFARSIGRADVRRRRPLRDGVQGALAGPPAQAVTAVNRSGLPVVAVDIPSGVDGMTAGWTVGHPRHDHGPPWRPSSWASSSTPQRVRRGGRGGRHRHRDPAVSPGWSGCPRRPTSRRVLGQPPP